MLVGLALSTMTLGENSHAIIPRHEFTRRIITCSWESDEYLREEDYEFGEWRLIKNDPYTIPMLPGMWTMYFN